MYKIGQVLYIIVNDSKTIEPVQVHSKQILESWDGTTVQHMCATIGNKTISLENHSEKGLLSGVFESVDSAKMHLLQLATELVEKLAKDAEDKSLMFEKPNESPETLAQPESVPSSERAVDEVPTIVLEDGTKARVHLPDTALI